MNKINPLTITKDMTKAEMLVQVATFIKDFGSGFHPDTLAEEYVVVKTGEPTFNLADQVQFDQSIQVLFDTFENRLYDFCGIYLEMLDN